MPGLLAGPPTPTTALWLTVAALILLVLILLYAAFAVYVHRKLLGFMQSRLGPNRVGPYGLLQTIADGAKLLVKESIVPAQVDRPLYHLAPVIAFAPAILVFLVLPWSSTLRFSDFAVGLLFYIAISSLTTVGVLMGGWSSNNKWSLIGAMRSVAQMLAYEIPLIVSALGVVVLAGSLNLTDIVEAQRKAWFVFPQILGFLVFAVSALAELNRSPFDLSEAESELIGGYLTEYGGMRFALFMLGEYVYPLAMGALATALYFGGWYPLPFGGTLPVLSAVPGWIWFLLKALFLSFVPFWFHASFPRMRIDQLMVFSWKVLFPVSLLNLLVTIVYRALAA
ncbi:MAG: NADH-quinone oxidoreductase subunit NuoH [Brockia lithotrophica]|nr:NADH-quinone oxidoreductase subunit NuoH [Brockia lithotrophica]